MASRSILPEHENPALRQVCRPIPRAQILTPEIQSLIADMRRLLAQEKLGVALAASQVGEPLQLFIVSGRALVPVPKEGKEAPPPPPDQVYINPEITKLSRAKKGKHEGCLSIRGLWGVVPRAEKVTIRAYDESGNLFTRGASRLLAHIFQHEMDHLEGILYTDKALEIHPDEDGAPRA